MGFCTPEQHDRFLKLCPQIEKFLVEGGTILIKYWLEVSNDEQKRRFEARIKDPLRQWKLSPMDLPSRTRWYDYSRARDIMLKKTDTRIAPWFVVRSDDKRTARLNLISHLLSRIPHKKLRGQSEAPRTLVEARVQRRCVDRAAAVRARTLLRTSRPSQTVSERRHDRRQHPHRASIGTRSPKR